MLTGTYEDIYYIILNAYLYQYPDIREFVKQQPIIRFDFVYWFATFVNKNHPIEPTYNQILNTLEELSVKYKIMSAFATGFQTRYNARKRARDDADIAATLAVENAIAKRRYAPARIRIVPSINRTQKLGELKGVDTDIDSASIPSNTNSNANIIGINLINQGSGSFNRVGRKVYPKSVRCTGEVHFVMSPDATTKSLQNSMIRCVLVWDKQPNTATLPQFQDVLGQTNALGVETSDIWNAVRYDNMARFKILKEWIVRAELGASSSLAGTVNGTTVVCHFDEFYNFKKSTKYETTYASTQTDPTPPTYTDIATGGLFLIYRRSTPDANAGNIVVNVVNGTARYRYTD